MTNLNQIVRRYLKANGISETFFAQWIGCDRTAVVRWLNGTRGMSPEYHDKIFAFLDGRFLTTFDKIVKVVE